MCLVLAVFCSSYIQKVAVCSVALLRIILVNYSYIYRIKVVNYRLDYW